MQSVNAITGSPISGLAYLRQRITDILTTPIGSRIMRRDYGSELFELIDLPLNDDTRISIIAATAKALQRWEPEIRSQRVVPRSHRGATVIDLYAHWVSEDQAIVLEGVPIQ